MARRAKRARHATDTLSGGKAATFHFFFPSSPRPWPNVEQNVMFVHFFAVPAQLRREITKFQVYLGTGTARRYCQNLGAVRSLQLHPNSLLLSTGPQGIIANKSERMRSLFFQRRFHGRRRCRVVRSLLATLRSEDGDGSENVAEKVNSRSFNLHRDYSKSLTLSNVFEAS